MHIGGKKNKKDKSGSLGSSGAQIFSSQKVSIQKKLPNRTLHKKVSSLNSLPSCEDFQEEDREVVLIHNSLDLPNYDRIKNSLMKLRDYLHAAKTSIYIEDFSKEMTNSGEKRTDASATSGLSSSAPMNTNSKEG